MCLGFTTQVSAQTYENRNCASQDILQQQIVNYPEMEKVRESIEQHTAEFAQKRSVSKFRSAINIPVVVHLLYNVASENLTDAQIQSQIDVLNEDFNKQSKELTTSTSIYKNSATSVGITFCLASVDANGNATKGIERKQSTRSTWGTSDLVKFSSLGGLDAWESKHYLNVWICNIGGGSIGYSQFPGGPALSDGIVIDYRFFGRVGSLKPFDKGRTLTHEVGHWLNLIHIWGDSQCGDDRVEDTPTHHNANYGCPSVPFVSNSCGSATTEMTMNFMDYVNDACMYMFTEGQKNRMLALFEPNMPRYDILTSQGCGFVAAPIVVCSAAKNAIVNNITENSASFSWSVDSSTVQQKLIYFESTQNSQQIVDLSTNIHSFEFVNLKSKSKYYAYILSFCKSGDILNSEVVIFNTLTPPPPKIICATAKQLSAKFISNNSATINWLTDSTTIQQKLVFFANGQTTQTILDLSNTTTTTTLSNLNNLTNYHAYILSICKTGSALNSEELLFSTLPAPIVQCIDPYENNNSRALSKEIPIQTAIKAIISDDSDRDWFKFKTEAHTRYTIKLSNLPQDYDLKIFNAQGKFINSSENDGTWDETITYIATKSDSIFVVIYGYTGNYDASSCYTLEIKAEKSAELSVLNDEKKVNNFSTFKSQNFTHHSSLNTVNIYPNPTSDFLNINTPEVSDDTEGNISLFDVNGKAVLNQRIILSVTATNTQISVINYPTGMYFLQTHFGETNSTFKVYISRE